MFSPRVNAKTNQIMVIIMDKIRQFFKFRMIFFNYLNSAPVNWRDPWIWCCMTGSCLVLTYLNLKALMLLIGEFLCLFMLIEGVSTRFEFFHYKWKVNLLRLIVSIPIYMSIYGTILCIKEIGTIVPTDWVDLFIFVFNSIIMAPIVYIVFNTSYRFLLHRTIPRRWELLVCTFGLYWTTLGKIIYSVIRRGPRSASVISYMLPNNPDQPGRSNDPRDSNNLTNLTDRSNKSTGSLGWTIHEQIRKAFDDRISTSRVGEHTGEASGPSDIQSKNLQAAADRVVRDCGRIVCKAVQSLKRNGPGKEDQSPKSPSQSPFNPF